MSRRQTLPVPVLEPSPDGRRMGAPRHGQLRALAIAATSATFLLIGLGALVRATGSGDACPDWPRCHGRWIPPIEYHNLIEYSHRLMATVVIVLVAALAAVAWTHYRRTRRVAIPAAAALGLVAFQAVLGAIVVWSKLEALNVTAHLATAMLLVASLVYATVAAHSVDVRPTGPRDRSVRLAWLAAGATFVLLMAGALVRGEGAGLAFRDWPLMDGRAVPGLSSVNHAVHFVHRALAALAALMVGWFVVRAWGERRRRPAVSALALVAGVLFAAQVMVGAASVWSGLAAMAVVAHVVLASLIWGGLVAAAATARVELALRGAAVRTPLMSEVGRP
jgi:heme A synthase